MWGDNGVVRMRKTAFTLIELLVVIAIIAILAAIAFPVIARAKDSAYRNSDIQSMNTIRAALQLYRVDQGGYPPALLGYVTLYQSGPNAGQVIPADQLKTYLYPKRVEAISSFKPAYNREAYGTTTLAVWPAQDPRPANSAPILDNDGDGAITNADDDACARQAFGPTETVTRRDPITNNVINAEYYAVSGYDVSRVRTPGGPRTELHYSLFWTRWGLASDLTCTPSGAPGSSLDDPRQLGYFDPPDNTVITWNTFFREYEPDNSSRRLTRDLVLFLGGSAKPYDSRTLSERSWRILP